MDQSYVGENHLDTFSPCGIFCVSNVWDFVQHGQHFGFSFCELWSRSWTLFMSFIPTCRNWLTAQHTTGSRSTGSRSMLPWTLHHPNQWINYFFYPLFLEGKTLKYVFWDKESLGLFQLCFLRFFVCPASLLLPLWPSTQTIHGGALIYGTLGRTGMS